MAEGFSKGQVRRAGDHLASRLVAWRRGERDTLVDEHDVEDVLAREIVDWWRAQHVQPLLRTEQAVRAAASGLLVSSRIKQFRTTIDKLTREPGKLADMADIGGVRAVVPTQEDVDDLAGVLRRQLDVRRDRDWARHPRPSGYRAVHLHVRQSDRWIEVQLRTFGQDAWANVVEREGALSGHAYKSGAGPEEVLEFFAHVAAMFAMIELGESHADLAARMHDAYRRAEPHLVTPMLKGLG